MPDWFTGGYAEAQFYRHLLRYAGTPDIHYLQIGAYCGDASVWLLRNVLTHPSSTLADVDTWRGSAEVDHEAIDFDEVQALYAKQTAPFDNVAAFHSTSDDFFLGTTKVFDFIYIDGSHQAHQVLRDAVNADARLRSGGIMAFDDYRWGGGARDVPAPAIDAFVRCFENDYEVLEAGLQVWVRKR